MTQQQPLPFVSGVVVGVLLGILFVKKNLTQQDFEQKKEEKQQVNTTLKKSSSYAHPKLVDNLSILSTYPSTHYCNNPLPPTDPRFIGVLSVYHRDVLILLRGPHHAGGYSTIVTLTDRNNKPSQICNRVPSRMDYEAILIVACQISDVFLSLGMFPQVELLGNNSHQFCKEERILRLGTEEEPFVPHAHVTGRGDTDHCYVDGVPLRGKVPGEVMVPRERCEEWADEEWEIPKVAQVLFEGLTGLDFHPHVAWKEKRCG